MVAPLVGAWIEILGGSYVVRYIPVAPLVGAWIEISIPSQLFAKQLSLLSWERGLKYYCQRT